MHLSREILCYCATCRDEIKKLLDNYDTLSDEVFFEGRKLLIQYYPKYSDKNKVKYMSMSD